MCCNTVKCCNPEKNKNLITFVEWPQLIKDNQKKVIELRFNYENDLNNLIVYN